MSVLARILVIDSMHEVLLTKLKDLNCEVDYEPNITKEKMLSKIHLYDGLVVRSKIEIDDTVLEQSSNLRFIARAGAGLDNINLESSIKYGVEILNAPEGNRDAVAEHSLGLLLALLNNFFIANKQVQERIWDREGNRGHELKEKTVAVIGYGYMGKAFARVLRPFGCKVLAYDKFLKDYSDDYIIEASMKQIFDEADIVSFHLPLTSVTKDLVDMKYLSNFRKNIWIMNTARGKILVLKDLLQGITEGKINGAALDVLENENISKLSNPEYEIFEKLVQTQKVVFTPHVAGWTFESYKKISLVLADKIKSFLVE